MTEKPFEIREIRESDRDCFLSLCKSFYASPAVLHTIPEAFHERTFQALMDKSPYLRCYLFCCGEETAGYALISLSFSAEAGGLVVWIEELYLKPAFRGMGAAHVFFPWLEKELPAARYRLETEADNHRAQKLYQSLGFRALPYQQMIKGD